MTKHMIVALLICMFGLLNPAHGGDEIREDWLSADVEMISQILMSINRWHVRSNVAAEQLRYVALHQEQVCEIGFGAQRHTFRRPGGYTRVRLRALVFDSSLAWVELRISSLSWDLVHERIEEAWRVNGGPPYELLDSGLVYKREYTDRYLAYQAEVAKLLGQQTSVSIPKDFTRDYARLNSPLYDDAVGVICGDAGSPPLSRAAIERLSVEGQWEIVENILRGFSPEGRVYAAISLLRAERHGRRIPEELRRTIDIVLNLEIPIGVCRGCIYTEERAASLVVEMLDQFDEFWGQGLR